MFYHYHLQNELLFFLTWHQPWKLLMHGYNGDTLSVFSPNMGKCWKNADQNNSEYGHFLRSVEHVAKLTNYY